MKRYTKVLVAIFGVAVIAGVVSIWWQQPAVMPPQQATVTTNPVEISDAADAVPAAPTSAPGIQHPIEAIQSTPTPPDAKLPVPQNTDSYVRSVLLGLVTAKEALQFLQLDSFVRHVVATVDNLPREQAPASVWPVNPIPGRFSTGAGDNSNPIGETTVNPNNSARYSRFVTFIESIDTAKWVTLYTQLYPLFQQAYVELGYPKAYFNDRLVVVIDHLLAVPVQIGRIGVHRVEVKGPFTPVRPWLTYEFTVPALNGLSAGQKMLLRSGSVNHQRLRTKLREIRGLIVGHVPAKKPASSPE